MEIMGVRVIKDYEDSEPRTRIAIEFEAYELQELKNEAAALIERGVPMFEARRLIERCDVLLKAMGQAALALGREKVG